MKRESREWFGLVVLAITLVPGLAQSPQVPPTQPVTTIDAALGRCTLDLTINTQDGKPASTASVKVHIAYGFGGFHKLDLEAGANAEGKVKFTGLPTQVRRPPLQFHAFTKDNDQVTGDADYDPAAECHAQRTITLARR